MNKTKVIIIVISFSAVFLSCSRIGQLIKLSKEEKVMFHSNGTLEFDIVENSIILPTEINGKKQDLIFDTRAPSILFLDKDKPWQDSLNLSKGPGKLTSAKGEKIDNYIAVIQNAENGLFNIENWLVRAMEWPVECDFRDGILGQDVFDLNKQVVLVDFDERQIKSTVQKIETKDWVPLRTKFRNGYITVFLTLNGIEIPFGFDTGFSGSLILKSEKKSTHILHSLPVEWTCYGNLIQSASGQITDTMVIYSIPSVQLTEEILIPHVRITESEQIKNNLLGMKFIQNFNFIIDYPSKQLLIKPRSTEYKEVPSFDEEFGIGLSLNNEMLTVAALCIGGIAESSGLHCNDEIIAINDTEMAEVPSCERKNQLITTFRSGSGNVLTIRREGEIRKITMEKY